MAAIASCALGVVALAGAVAGLAMSAVLTITLAIAVVGIIVGLVGNRATTRRRAQVSGRILARSGIALNGIVLAVSIAMLVVTAAVGAVAAAGRITVDKDEMAIAGGDMIVLTFETGQPGTLEYEVEVTSDEPIVVSIYKVSSLSDRMPDPDDEPDVERAGRDLSGSLRIARGAYSVLLECHSEDPCQVAYELVLAP